MSDKFLSIAIYVVFLIVIGTTATVSTVRRRRAGRRYRGDDPINPWSGSGQRHGHHSGGSHPHGGSSHPHGGSSHPHGGSSHPHGGWGGGAEGHHGGGWGGGGGDSGSPGGHHG
jgi:hypothetical protein